MDLLVIDIVIGVIVVIALAGLITLLVLRWRARPLPGDTAEPGSDDPRFDVRNRPGAEYRSVTDTKLSSGGGGLGL